MFKKGENMKKSLLIACLATVVSTYIHGSITEINHGIKKISDTNSTTYESQNEKCTCIISNQFVGHNVGVTKKSYTCIINNQTFTSSEENSLNISTGTRPPSKYSGDRLAENTYHKLEGTYITGIIMNP